MLLGLRFVKDVGAGSAGLVVAERERHGPYAGATDLVRRTGLKPQAEESLIMAGAFDSLTPNRRRALWDAGLSTRSGRNGQRAFPAENSDVPNLPDFTAHERMAGECWVMGIYPQGHLMEFVRPYHGLADVMPAATVEGDAVLKARLAHSPAASPLRGQYRIRNHRGRELRRAAEPVAHGHPRRAGGSWAAMCCWCGA